MADKLCATFGHDWTLIFIDGLYYYECRQCKAEDQEPIDD